MRPPAALEVLYSARMRMMGLFRIPGHASARWCGMVAVTYLLTTSRQYGCLNTRFCRGSK